MHVHVGFPRPPLSHVMGFQVVVLPPCFARPPQLVVRCGARTCIDGTVARFSAHGFLIVCYCESLQSHMAGCCGDFWSCRPFSHAECLTLQKPKQHDHLLGRHCSAIHSFSFWLVAPKQAAPKKKRASGARTTQQQTYEQATKKREKRRAEKETRLRHRDGDGGRLVLARLAQERLNCQQRFDSGRLAMTPRTPPSSGLAAASPAAAGTPSVGGGSPPLPDNPFARTPPAAPGALFFFGAACVGAMLGRPD